MSPAVTGDELKELFARTQALITGHFRLSSGRHSGQYFQCARLLADTAIAERLGQALAGLAEARWRAQSVVGPALGGIIIAHETARALNLRSLFAERREGSMTVRRGFDIRPGEKIIVVEDVITTGKSTGEVLAVLRALGAEPVAALSLVNRSPQAPNLGVPVKSLAHWPAASYTEADCPLCKESRPIIKPGSRA